MEYLQRQRKLWPDVRGGGVAARSLRRTVIQKEMVADFKHRHRTGKVDLDKVSPYARIVLKLDGSQSVLLRQLQCDVHP